MPGSVIAMAVISSPDAIPGSQRRRCSSVRERQEVGEADVGVQREPEARRRRRRRTAAPRRSPGCSGSRRRRRRRTPRARPCPRNPAAPAVANSSRGTMPGVVPLEVVRHDLPLDERAEAVAEEVVLLGELRAAHAARIRPHSGSGEHLARPFDQLWRQLGPPVEQLAAHPVVGRPLDPLAVAPRRLDEPCVRGSIGATASDVARVWYASLSPLRNTSAGTSSARGILGREAGNQLVAAGAVREHPPLHRRRRTRRGPGRGCAAGSTGCGRSPLPIRGARRRRPCRPSHAFTQVLAAVVHAQAHEPEGAAADPPDREPGGDVGVARRGEHRHPRAARAAADDGGRQVEVPEQARRGCRPAWRTRMPR